MTDHDLHNLHTLYQAHIAYPNIPGIHYFPSASLKAFSTISAQFSQRLNLPPKRPITLLPLNLSHKPSPVHPTTLQLHLLRRLMIMV